MEEERRRAPRYPFVATAEVIPDSSRAVIPVRVTEISLYGCYVEMPDALEERAKMKIKIQAEGRFFESQATVIYSEPKQGMGICFQNLNPHYHAVLKRWLLEAARAKFGKQG